MNAKKIVTVAATLAFATFGVANTAKAQEMPGWGLGDIAAANANFDANFDVMARQVAWQAALATPNDQPLPFNAMTISRSISDGNNSFQGYMNSVQANSNGALNSVEQYDVNAVRGNAYYTPQYPAYQGETYELPYTSAPAAGYTMDNGYIYGGNVEGGNNLVVAPTGGEQD